MGSSRPGYYAGVQIGPQRCDVSGPAFMRCVRWLFISIALGVAAGACATNLSSPESRGGPDVASRATTESRCRRDDVAACGELGRLLGETGSDKDLERGLVLLELACGRDDLPACTSLGLMYTRRSKVDRATSRGRDLLTGACRRRHAPACTGAGEIIRKTAPPGDREGSEYLRTACELGDARGCELYGLDQRDDAFSGDKVRAENALAAACRMGRRSSCHFLAMALRQDPARQSEGTALLIENCEQGHGPSCTELALTVAPLVSSQPNCAAVLRVAERACHRDNRDVCVLGDACVVLSQPKQAPAAIERLRVACERRSALGCLYWADARERHTSGAAEGDRIRAAYLAACRDGPPAADVACPRLAVANLAQAPNREDADRSIGLLQDACDRGQGAACCALANQYESGKWVPADAVKASALRSKACAGGQQPCCGGEHPP